MKGKEFAIGSRIRIAGDIECHSCFKRFPRACTDCGRGLVHATDDFLKKCDNCGDKNCNHDGFL